MVVGAQSLVIPVRQEPLPLFFTFNGWNPRADLSTSAVTTASFPAPPSSPPSLAAGEKVELDFPTITDPSDPCLSVCFQNSNPNVCALNPTSDCQSCRGLRAMYQLSRGALNQPLLRTLIISPVNNASASNASVMRIVCNVFNQTLVQAATAAPGRYNLTIQYSRGAQTVAFTKPMIRRGPASANNPSSQSVTLTLANANNGFYDPSASLSVRVGMSSGLSPSDFAFTYTLTASGSAAAISTSKLFNDPFFASDGRWALNSAVVPSSWPFQVRGQTFLLTVTATSRRSSASGSLTVPISFAPAISAGQCRLLASSGVAFAPFTLSCQGWTVSTATVMQVSAVPLKSLSTSNWNAVQTADKNVISQAGMPVLPLPSISGGALNSNFTVSPPPGRDITTNYQVAFIALVTDTATFSSSRIYIGAASILPFADMGQAPAANATRAKLTSFQQDFQNTVGSGSGSTGGALDTATALQFAQQASSLLQTSRQSDNDQIKDAVSKSTKDAAEQAAKIA